MLYLKVEYSHSTPDKMNNYATYLTVSAEPLSPPTVENRTTRSVRLPI